MCLRFKFSVNGHDLKNISLISARSLQSVVVASMLPGFVRIGVLEMILAGRSQIPHFTHIEGSGFPRREQFGSRGPDLDIIGGRR